MKLIGIGLEEGTLGVASYLSSVEVGKDGKPLKSIALPVPYANTRFTRHEVSAG